MAKFYFASAHLIIHEIIFRVQTVDIPKTLINSDPLVGHMGRTYEEWWKTVPEDLKKRTRKGDEQNKPLLNQVNYVLLHLHLAGKHDAKPSHAELKDWLHSGQVDVLRMTKK